MVRKLTLMAGLATLALTAVPTVAAAKAPGVATGAASKVTSTSVRLSAKVAPRSRSTTYSFQYGTTRKYGGGTATFPAGSGSKTVSVSADLAGLTGNTLYHYRVVASNQDGVVSGKDRQFRTAKVPLSLSVAATPNPVGFGGATTITGVLSGTHGPGKTIQLQQKGFPFTAPDFANAPVSPVVTGADGSFALTVAGLTQNVQYRVYTTTGKRLVSAPVLVGVAPTVRTAVSTTRPRRGTLVRFAGTVTPRFVPAQVAIQRKGSTGAWLTVGGVYTRSYGTAKARYAKSVRIRNAGTYRVFVGLPNSQFAGSTGPEFRIIPRSR
ncbi:hypothetical protein DSM112329_00167 [Paraconexibacter sp. AEG42_29]|uniref:Fibronectin type-III domain-containing protein n=1 Tax=Paraconexibacter sp. AEG42_29 TaxID=2997339 RepID=A0AAU7AP22_9ACTN